MLDGGMVLTREEKWKEMKLARIFEQRQHISISNSRNHIGDSTYVAHLGNHKQFLKKVEHHLDDKGEVVFIADGAKWIRKWAEAMYPQTPQILDYYHAKQHLCQWAEIAIKDTGQKNHWIHEQCFWLLNNGIDRVIENIKQIKVHGTQVKKDRQLLIAYYTANRNRMQYIQRTGVNDRFGADRSRPQACDSTKNEIIRTTLDYKRRTTNSKFKSGGKKQ